MTDDPTKPRVFVERAHRADKRTYFTLSIPNDLADRVASRDADLIGWASRFTLILEQHRDEPVF